MKYGEVFSTSWKIVWKFKVLWIFGILSSCMRSTGNGSGSNGGGGGGGSSFLAPHGVQASHGPSLTLRSGHWLQLFQMHLEEQPWLIAVLVIAMVLVISAIIVFSLLAGTLGRVGVARGAWLADEGQQKLGFALLLKESWPYFWRVFLLLLLIGLAGLVLASVFFLPIVLLTILSFGLIWLILIPLLLPLSLLFIGLALAINALIEEAVIAIVGENLGIFAALARAWKLLWERPFPQLMMSFLLSVIRFVVILVLALPILLIAVPFLVSLLFQTDVATSIGAVISGISFLLYMIVMLTASGVLYAYMGTAWTLTFRRLTNRQNDVALETGSV